MERTMNVEFSVAFERKGKARKIAEACPAREVAPDPGRQRREGFFSGKLRNFVSFGALVFCVDSA